MRVLHSCRDYIPVPLSTVKLCCNTCAATRVFAAFTTAKLTERLTKVNTRVLPLHTTKDKVIPMKCEIGAHIHSLLIEERDEQLNTTIFVSCSINPEIFLVAVVNNVDGTDSSSRAHLYILRLHTTIEHTRNRDHLLCLSCPFGGLWSLLHFLPSCLCCFFQKSNKL